MSTPFIRSILRRPRWWPASLVCTLAGCGATGSANDFKFSLGVAASLDVPSTASPASPGQEEDAALGLYYYGARYYDPTLGRFTQNLDDARK